MKFKGDGTIIIDIPHSIHRLIKGLDLADQDMVIFSAFWAVFDSMENLDTEPSILVETLRSNFSKWAHDCYLCEIEDEEYNRLYDIFANVDEGLYASKSWEGFCRRLFAQIDEIGVTTEDFAIDIFPDVRKRIITLHVNDVS